MSPGNGLVQLTAKDFKSDQEVRWCPGCGDYAILAGVQSFLPELGIPRENLVYNVLKIWADGLRNSSSAQSIALVSSTERRLLPVTFSSLCPPLDCTQMVTHSRGNCFSKSQVMSQTPMFPNSR